MNDSNIMIRTNNATAYPTKMTASNHTASNGVLNKKTSRTNFSAITNGLYCVMLRNNGERPSRGRIKPEKKRKMFHAVYR